MEISVKKCTFNIFTVIVFAQILYAQDTYLLVKVNQTVIYKLQSGYYRVCFFPHQCKTSLKESGRDAH